ncbi:hypothetical protein [Mitsuaria sp. 7]|uniref:hypothetical protein n=1 Tax=Mitsuaria sp. 7 TaxID=1658665 RepID=UPI0007DDC361|nr:hypothetical protein [Mitsuaria sp. 7]ANH67095.1 hypothetical protein ABE85_05055 [Mitsuaria sp. 7]
MTGIRALPSTPYVPPTAARPGSGALASATAAAADFPTVMRDHHKKLISPTEPTKARPRPETDLLATMSRRPDIEAMIERQHAARKASLCAKGPAVARGDDDDADLCDEHHEDPPAWRVDPCGHGPVHGAPVECAPMAEPKATLVTNFVLWYPFEAARTTLSTVKAQPRRRRRPASAEQHRVDQQQAEVDEGET